VFVSTACAASASGFGLPAESAAAPAGTVTITGWVLRAFGTTCTRY